MKPSYAAMNMILDTIEQVGPDRKKVITALGNIRGPVIQSSARSRSTITARTPCR